MIRRSIGCMAVVLRHGDSNDLVRLLQARLNRDYPLYSNVVTRPRTTAVVREFQRRAGLQVDGIAGPLTLGRLGLNFDQPPPLPTDRPFFYCASGTWATPFQGPPFDVGWRVEQMGLVRNQPVGYPAAGFLFPNPFLSYNESVAQGVAELMRLILMNAGQFYLCGYSQGAEVVVRTLRLMLPGQPLAHRAGDLLKVITFGNPCRPPGPTLLGNNPPGAGISGIYTPEQFRSRTYDFILNGDIYPAATDDTLLHLGYEASHPAGGRSAVRGEDLQPDPEQRVPRPAEPRQYARDDCEVDSDLDRGRRLSHPQSPHPLQRLA